MIPNSEAASDTLDSLRANVADLAPDCGDAGFTAGCGSSQHLSVQIVSSE